VAESAQPGGTTEGSNLNRPKETQKWLAEATSTLYQALQPHNNHNKNHYNNQSANK
jgi:hypothetical protein